MDCAGEARASCTSTCVSSSCLVTASTFRLEYFMATGELGGPKVNMREGGGGRIKMDNVSKSWFEYFVLRRYSVHEDVDLKEIISGVHDSTLV